MKNKHKSLIWLLLFLKLIVSLQKISCINMKSSNHTVLFICLGNICRSPAAEGIMKAKVEEKGLASQFYIDSAAIGPWAVARQSYAPLRCRSWLLFRQSCPTV